MSSALTPCWFNDEDPTIWAAWTSMAFYTDAIKQKLLAFEPSIDSYQCSRRDVLQCSDSIPTKDNIVHIACAKLALHQMSYSGLGLKAGGPMGGWAQGNQSIGSRWSPLSICKRIDTIAQGLSRCRITCKDFAEMLQDDGRATIYLDPPYFRAGSSLYQHGFSLADHLRLCKILRHCPHNWLLSYDDCPEIRELYSFAKINELPVTYSISAKRRTTELLISPRSSNQTFLAMAA